MLSVASDAQVFIMSFEKSSVEDFLCSNGVRAEIKAATAYKNRDHRTK